MEIGEKIELRAAKWSPEVEQMAALVEEPQGLDYLKKMVASPGGVLIVGFMNGRMFGYVATHESHEELEILSGYAKPGGGCSAFASVMPLLVKSSRALGKELVTFTRKRGVRRMYESIGFRFGGFEKNGMMRLEYVNQS